MRIAQVARMTRRMRPTSEAAVITPTDNALFCKNDFGWVAASAVADAEADEEVAELEDEAGNDEVLSARLDALV